MVKQLLLCGGSQGPSNKRNSWGPLIPNLFICVGTSLGTKAFISEAMRLSKVNVGKEGRGQGVGEDTPASVPDFSG